MSAASDINGLAQVCFARSEEAGRWRDLQTGENLLEYKLTFAVKLCLIHSEISEAMEGDRKHCADEKLPHRKMLEVELADAMIRILGLAGALKLDLGGAFVEKLEYNRTHADHAIANRVVADGKKY